MHAEDPEFNPYDLQAGQGKGSSLKLFPGEWLSVDNTEFDGALILDKVTSMFVDTISLFKISFCSSSARQIHMLKQAIECFWLVFF